MRKAAFWIAVGGTAVIANFVMELAADRVSSDSPFGQLVAYIHRGPSKGSA
jgi:hypothetical protein